MMEKTDNASSGGQFPGSVPMARINGARIRRLREDKGLTQLYLATVIEVTTDTISRWENRRYPSIKLENAEKLAQALEVELATILEQDQAGDVPAISRGETEGGPVLPEPGGPSPAPRLPLSRRLFSFPLLLILVLAVLVAGLSLWWPAPAPLEPGVEAQRVLPDHVPPGQTFPVLIRVSTSQKGSVALILKEMIPPGCRVVSGEPPITSVDTKSGALKWISRAGDHASTTFSYLLRAPVKGSEGDQLRFSGGATLNQGDQNQGETGGTTTLVLAPYHWADVDRNSVIDDEEILAVYDQYGMLEQLDFERDMIDSIWTSGGYAWERKTGKYVLRK